MRTSAAIRAFAVAVVAASIACGSAPEPTALERYVRTPDPAYRYELIDTLRGHGYTAFVLELTSQSWLDDTAVDRTLWQHWLTVVRPDRVAHSTGLLYISGGRNGRPPPAEAHPLLTRIAVETDSVTALVQMVPNQPLTFAGENEGRREDALVAYAWDRYLRGGDPDWLPRLPMTKSAVRAMDAVIDFAAGDTMGDIDLSSFVVAGASKRGWTTWTTAAVDPRVVAIVPIVIDLLNVEPSFAHHWRVYGFWSPAIQDYVDMGIPAWFGSDEFRALLEIVGPYSYRERLVLPKLILNAAGDPFFVPDSSRFYFDDLPGEKYLRYVPNADHFLRETDAWDNLLAFYRTVLDDRVRPIVSWRAVSDDTLEVETDLAPSLVRLWQASNRDARDFRLGTVGKSWTDSELRPRDDGTYLATVVPPEQGWTAFFVELSYVYEGSPEPFVLTTGVRVVPEVLPFPPFEPPSRR